MVKADFLVSQPYIRDAKYYNTWEGDSRQMYVYSNLHFK